MAPDELLHATVCCQRFPQLTCSAALNSQSADSAADSNGEAQFDLMRVIGVGATSVVYLAKRLALPNPQKSPTGSPQSHQEAAFVAVKVINLEGRDGDYQRRCFTELECLSMCSCFSVLRDHADFRYPSDAVDLRRVQTLVLVLDYASSGDLRREVKLRRLNEDYFTEQQAAMILLQLTMALKYVHDHRILHRDVKSSNVLLCSNGLVKLGDFGLSHLFSDEVRPTECNQDPPLSLLVSDVFCGTPFYVAPEVWLRKPYGYASDMYSLGVVLFEMLALHRPYEHKDLQTLRELVLAQSIPGADWTAIEQRYPCLIHIARGLLEPDPQLRMTVDVVLAQPVMRWSVSTLLQIAHTAPDVDLAPADRDRVCRGVRRLSLTVTSSHRRHRAGLSQTGRTSSSVSNVSGGGASSVFSASNSCTTSPSRSKPNMIDVVSEVVASPNVCGSRSTSFVSLPATPSSAMRGESASPARRAKETYVVLKDGYVWKDLSGLELKKRFLALCRLQPAVDGSDACDGGAANPLDDPAPLSVAPQFVLVISHGPGDKKVAQRTIQEFEDVFSAPSSALAARTDTDMRFGFVLMLRDGSRLVFRSEHQEDCRSWVESLEQALVASL